MRIFRAKNRNCEEKIAEATLTSNLYFAAEISHFKLSDAVVKQAPA